MWIRILVRPRPSPAPFWGAVNGLAAAVLLALSATATLASAASLAFAQGRPVQCIVPPCPPNPCDWDRGCPRPMPIVDVAAERTQTRVTATLDGRIVRYEIDERYINRGGRPAEVDYLLPLPKGAAFEGLELSINGEMVAGETMRAEKARAVYEEIVRKLKDPALVEWMGHDLLRTRIFPIQPGEEKRVVVRFRAVIEREGDALRLDWPGRVRAGGTRNGDRFDLSYPRDAAGETLGDAYSPTHRLESRDFRNTEQFGRPRWPNMIQVSAANAIEPMTVLVPVRRAREATVSFTAHRPRGEDGYALITIAPPARPESSTPRDLTFVLDVSGSMSGTKMEQARAAGRQFLEALAPTDRFRIIAFSSDVRDFRDGWSAATSDRLRDAREFVDGLRASGGTNIDGALSAALDAHTPRGRIGIVLFLTDGAPTVGETQPARIAEHAASRRGERRVFTFGIGADVNAQLLEQLALQGRGTASYVRPNESVERAVSVVSERLTAPVATDLTIRVDGVRLHAVQPQGALDLFAGQDLVVLARYSGARSGAAITVEGRGPDGPVRWTSRADAPSNRSDNAFVARLWAVQRIGWLSAERRRTGGNPELDGELRQLGERFGIPTELTSYLVVEPGMQVNTGGVARRDLGSAPSSTSVMGAVAGTGTVANAPVAAAPALAERSRFEAARQSSDQRAAKSLADVAKNEEKESTQRFAGSRTFRLDNGVWTDSRAQGAGRTVTVKPFSDAYFALMREVPELKEIFAIGDRVRIHGRTVTLVLAPDGATSLDAAAITAIAREW
ncbi:MAG: VWA domain-containing protein [Gemmatimonadetes bacterium]|nr:VWA domain-containing protein [Gemmatimonadota bacterium]